jgi:hypothetical protein
MGISAFLDESGKFKDHPVVSLCALVSATAHFNAFAEEWDSCLKIAGLEVISAKKVLNANRPLSHKLPALGIDKRADALLPFIACIRKHLAFITGVAVDVAGFKGLPSHYHQIFGDDPFYTAFARTVPRIAELSPKGGKISLICDDEEQTALPMYKFYRRLKLIDPDARDKLAAISFADDSVLFGIQAADLVASIMRFEAHRNFFGTEYDYHKLHEAITQQPGGDEQIRLVEYAFCDEKMLRRTADGLRKIKRKPEGKPAKARGGALG